MIARGSGQALPWDGACFCSSDSTSSPSSSVSLPPLCLRCSRPLSITVGPRAGRWGACWGVKTEEGWRTGRRDGWMNEWKGWGGGAPLRASRGSTCINHSTGGGGDSDGWYPPAQCLLLPRTPLHSRWPCMDELPSFPGSVYPFSPFFSLPLLQWCTERRPSSCYSSDKPSLLPLARTPESFSFIFPLLHSHSLIFVFSSPRFFTLLSNSLFDWLYLASFSGLIFIHNIYCSAYPVPPTLLHLCLSAPTILIPTKRDLNNVKCNVAKYSGFHSFLYIL